jgi:hypothetical protein
MFSGVTIAADGTLFGASDGGGAYLWGTVFAIRP